MAIMPATENMGRRSARRYRRCVDGYPSTSVGASPSPSSRASNGQHATARSCHLDNDRSGISRARRRTPTTQHLNLNGLTFRIFAYAIVIGCIAFNYFYLSQSTSSTSDSTSRQLALQSKAGINADEDAEHFMRTGKIAGHGPRLAGKAAANGERANHANASSEKSSSGVAELPPLSSIVDANGNIAEGAAISSLLDFSIIGFPKTGTTSIHRHLADLTISLPKEHCELVVNDTAKLVKEIYKDHTRRSTQSRDGRSQLRGIKCPQDVSADWSRHNYAKHFPRTKLIVGIRHPVFWFESLYNFRVSHGKEMPHTSKLTKGCHSGSQGVCVWRANFHDFLLRLAKTPMHSPSELKLLSLNLETVRSKVGPVFIYDLSQLSEVKFRRDLREFLGLETDIPPFPAVDTSGRFDHISSKKKIDICLPEHGAIRAALMTKARSASVWIRDYFLKSDEVYVSDRPYFEDILKSWMNDPCG